MHILLPESDNCPSCISRRERITTENISWSNLQESMLATWQESNPQPPDHQLDAHPMEPPRLEKMAKNLPSISIPLKRSLQNKCDRPGHSHSHYLIRVFSVCWYMSQRKTKPTTILVRPVKTQISLRICAVWSESSLIPCAFYSLQAIQRGIKKNACPTGWMYRLTWVFDGHTGLIVGFVMRWLIFYCIQLSC